MKITRIYLAQSAGLAAKSKSLLAELREALGVSGLSALELIERYDIESPPLDPSLLEEVFPGHKSAIDIPPDCRVLLYQTLPGQFDQHADSIRMCLEFSSPKSEILVNRATICLLFGSITDGDIQKIKAHIINPVESEEVSESLPSSLSKNSEPPEGVEIIKGFISLAPWGLEALAREMSLAIEPDDLAFCQNYFKTEGRDPSVAEIKILDAYWSDHCRHTTFLTRLDAEIEPEYIKSAYEKYIAARDAVGGSKTTLMSVATIAMKHLLKQGKLENLELSAEVNACTVKVKAQVDGKPEDWLLLFKNETHNHPTEIEPFGGAATCLGGGIRDPLSGRAVAYQAMRISGAADPRTPYAQTIKGKLPQRKITKTAAEGYSSYGNQIGVAAGLVDEIYHPGFAAKRMELGAVVAAAPAANVVKTEPAPGDVVILLGGRTGRDGVGGASGSSKSHTAESLKACSAEVQKGNAPIEKMIQRLFAKPEVTRLIKRCNDFGAGGVSVAVGELADGLDINLDAVPLKYKGLSGAEIATSESQERMALVVSEKDAEFIIKSARAENLEATVIASVTANSRMTMRWRGAVIVDLSREFLNSNGAEKSAFAKIPPYDLDGIYKIGTTDCRLGTLDCCSKNGLIEMFDGTAGGGTVLYPLGGKFQQTPQQVMAAKLPGGLGMETASLMAYGYDPYLSEKSPFHGAACAVVESVAKIIAAGGELSDIYLSFQEYFPKTLTPERWGLPLASLLGAMEAQFGLGLASVGGKDSMSGSFGEDLNVPPTLISFAVAAASAEKIISSEFKAAGRDVYLLAPEYDGNKMPKWETLTKLFKDVSRLIKSGAAKSAYAVSRGGVEEAIFKMAIGNGIGFEFDKNFALPDEKLYGAIIVELDGGCTCETDCILLGKTLEKPVIKTPNETHALEELQAAWEAPLAGVFPRKAERLRNLGSCRQGAIHLPLAATSAEVGTQGDIISSNAAKPRVLIPLLPGANGEGEVVRGFDAVGGETSVCVIRNLTPALVLESFEAIARELSKAQILVMPGGSISHDGIDYAKICGAFFKNPKAREALDEFISRGGLVLGLGGGFAALCEMGLLSGEFSKGEHMSRFAGVKITSNNSPWLSGANIGDVYNLPISHSLGEFTPGADMTIASEFTTGGVEGIFASDGRILGKLSQSDRVIGKNICKNVPLLGEMKLFENGVRVFS